MGMISKNGYGCGYGSPHSEPARRSLLIHSNRYIVDICAASDHIVDISEKYDNQLQLVKFALVQQNYAEEF